MSATENESVQDQIDQLKKQNQNLLERISVLERQIQAIQTTEKRSPVEQACTENQSSLNIKLKASDQIETPPSPELHTQKDNISQDPLTPPLENGAEQLLEDVQELFIHSDEKPVKKNLEANIGKFWFNRIGIVVLIFGLGSLMVYAIQNNFLTPKSQLISGVLTAFALIIAGEVTAKLPKYHHWARSLIGGGLAFLYFIAYSAYHFSYYQLATGLSQTTDIILLSLIVAIAIGIAFRHDSQVIISGAFFMGFHTSFLSRGVGSLTLVYGIILTVGLLSAVTYKKWVNLTIGGTFASYILLAVWIDKNPSQIGLALLTISGYFILYSLQFPLTSSFENNKQNLKSLIANLLNIIFFAGLSLWIYLRLTDGNGPHPELIQFSLYLILYWFVFNLITLAIPKPNQPYLQKSGVIILTLNILCYSYLSLPLFLDHYPQYKVFIPLSLSLIYLISYIWSKNYSRFELLSQMYLYLSVLFLTSTIALQFKEETLTYLWAFESVVLRIMANRLQIKTLKYCFYAINLLSISKLAYDFALLLVLSEPELSHIQLLGYVLSCFSLYLSIWLMKKDPDQTPEKLDLVAKVFKIKNISSLKTTFIQLNSWGGTLGLYCAFELWLPTTTLPLVWLALIGLNLYLSQSWKVEAFRHAAYAINLLIICRVILIQLGMGIESFSSNQLSLWELSYFGLSIGSTYLISYYLNKMKEQVWLVHLNSWAGPLGWLALFQLWLSSHYHILACLLIIISSAFLGIGLKIISYRFSSYLLIALSIEQAFTIVNDLSPLLRLLTMSALIITTYGLSYVYEQNRESLIKEEKEAPLLHLWVGAWFAIFWIAIEFSSYGISVGWGILAVAIVLSGFIINYQPLRIQGLILVGLTMGKVFLYDTSSLETIYKIISYIGLGCILLAASFIYTRYQDKISL